jgi:hypothetical protein
MRGKDKQHAGRFFIAVQEAIRDPGRSEHRMIRPNRQPRSAKERVEPSLLDDDGYFGMWIDTSWNPSIRRDGHLLNVERLAPLTCAHQDASLQPRAAPALLLKSCLLMTGTYTPFRDLPDGNVEPGNA